MIKTEAALRALRRAVNRLDPEQGPVARKNARRAIGAAYRVLKQRIDEEYPSLVKAKPSKPTASIEVRRRKLLARGYVRNGGVGGTALLLACAEAGITPTVLRWRELPSFMKQARECKELWIPGWCEEIGPDPAKLRRAKKSASERKVLQAASALLALGNKPA